MPPPPSSRSGARKPGQRSRQQGRLRGSAKESRGRLGGRHRILVHGKRPHTPGGIGNTSVASPTSVADNVNGGFAPIPGCITEEAPSWPAYEEAVAAATAVINARNSHGESCGQDSNVENGDASDAKPLLEVSGAEDSDSNANGVSRYRSSAVDAVAAGDLDSLIDMQDDDVNVISSADAFSSTDVLGGAGEKDDDANRFAILTEEGSSSISEDNNSELNQNDSDSSSDGGRNNRFNAIVRDDSSIESEHDDDDSDLSMPGFEDNDGVRSNAPEPEAEDSAVESDDDEDEDPDAAKCAVCFLRDDQTHKWRRLVTLPCCGLDGKEKSSSTRFCAACILKMATNRYDSESRNEYPPRVPDRSEVPVTKFYEDDVQTERRRVIECPRCRDILVVNIKKLSSHSDGDDEDDCSCDCSDRRLCGISSSTDWTNPKNARSVSVRVPSFKERCRYAGKKVGLARILWRVAFLHHSFMPREALGKESELPGIHKLVGWGILQKVKGKRNRDDLYHMDTANHLELIKLLGLENIDVTEEYGKGDGLILELMFGMGCALVTHAFCKFRLDRAWRIMNRFMLLALFFKGYLPPYPLTAWQEWTVTLLNVFAVCMIFQFVCIVLMYVGSFFGVGITVCYLLRQQGSSGGSNTSKWWRCLSLALVLYFGYRTGSAFANDIPFISYYFRTVAPWAVVAIKKVIWD